MESVSDIMIYRESLNRLEPSSPFSEQRIVSITDQNSGSYNSTITIDTSSINSSDQWADFKNAYLILPYVVSMRGSVNNAVAALNPVPTYNSLLFKNGYFQAIDSIQVSANGRVICQQTQNINQFATVKLLTQFSRTELEKLGPSIGFMPDTGDTLTYTSAALGYTNNVINPTANNIGAYRRATMTMSAVSLTPENNDSAVNDNQVAKNYYAGIDSNNVYTWVYMLQIRLRDVLDYFDKVPITKGVLYQFLITYNSCKDTMTVAAGAITGMTHIQLSGNTNPIMLAGAGSEATAVAYLGTANLTGLEISCGIKTNSLNPIVTPAIPNCRLYVPTYRIEPSHLASLIENNPVTKVEYQDVYVYFSLNNISPGNEFNQVVTNSVPGRVRCVITIPRPTANATNVTNEIQSILSSSPSTTLKNGFIKNYNLQIGGVNVWQDNEQWDFCQFNDALQYMNCIDGLQVNGIASGLISFKDFQSAYRYYVADCTRLSSSIDTSNRSVTPRGNNNTNTTNNYIVFVSYDKHVDIETATGRVL